MAEGILTPQQELFLASYPNPQSPTFGNAKQSALKAGYSETYSENITDAMPSWLLENIGDMKLLEKAERVLNETLEVDHVVPAMGMFGPIVDKETKEPVMKVDSKILGNKLDAAKFVAETVGKKRYSKKSPLTDDDGKPLTITLVNYGNNSAPQL